MAHPESESRAPLAGGDPAHDAQLEGRDAQHGPAGGSGQGSDEPLIAVIPKNAREEIRVQLRLFKGHRFLDLRLYAHNGSGLVPTKSGISLRFAALRDVALALDEAYDEAIRLGYIPVPPGTGGVG